MIANSWPILPKEEHKFYTYDYALEQYVLYVPTKRKTRDHANKCQVTLSSGETYTLPSVMAAAKFIGRDPEYFRVALKEGKVIKDSNGNVVTAVRLD